jgi:hypothetical protein
MRQAQGSRSADRPRRYPRRGLSCRRLSDCGLCAAQVELRPCWKIWPSRPECAAAERASSRRYRRPDLSRRISKDDRRLCEDQMALSALKEGLEPSGPEWDAAVRHLRKAVKEHDAKF